MKCFSLIYLLNNQQTNLSTVFSHYRSIHSGWARWQRVHEVVYKRELSQVSHYTTSAKTRSVNNKARHQAILLEREPNFHMLHPALRTLDPSLHAETGQLICHDILWTKPDKIKLSFNSIVIKQVSLKTSPGNTCRPTSKQHNWMT